MSEFQVRLANGKAFGAGAGRSLLAAAQSSGLNLEHGCRNGRCGNCRVRVLSGSTVSLGAQQCLSAAERQQGWALSCTDAPTSDLLLDCEDLDDAATVAPRLLPARIQRLQQLTPDVLHVVLRLPPGQRVSYRPGQYFDIIGTGGLRRSYSAACAPQPGGPLEFLVRRVAGGAMSDYWFERAAPDDLLRIDGPRGTAYLRPVAGRDVLLLATGTGIAPVKAMLEAMAGEQPRSVRLLWGARRRDELFWAPEATSLQLNWTPVLSRPDAAWTGARGHVQDVLLAARMNLAHADVYACGNPAMVDDARAALLSAGLPRARFHADAFVSSAPAALPAAAGHCSPKEIATS